MNHKLISYLLVGTVGLVTAATSLGQTQPATVTVIATFDYPGAQFTFAGGISNHGLVAGGFDDLGGFVRNVHGQFSSPIVYSVRGHDHATYATGINSSGVVCGWFQSAGAHGFFKGKRFIIYDVPGSLETYIFGENNAGDFVGYDTTDAGYANFAGSVTVIKASGLGQTWAYGINSAREIVGYHTPDGIVRHGFYRDASGSYTTPLDYPGAKATTLTSINDQGVIVGSYTDANDVSHGLVLTLPNSFSSFDLPGATSTAASGINNAGKISGTYYTADGHAHGFIARLGDQ